MIGRCSLAFAGVALAAALARDARAQTVVVDEVAVRFVSPETGGIARPRFITARVLHFEARVESLAEQLPIEEEGQESEIADRHLRAALEHHVAEEMLAAQRSDAPPSPQQIAELRDQLRLALYERVAGSTDAAAGAAAVQQAANEDGIGPREVDAYFEREARAAIYLDRVSPLLHPDEETLREVFRTSAHPYRSSKTFDAVKAPLERWFVGERLRVAEASFLQQARTRVKIVATQSMR